MKPNNTKPVDICLAYSIKSDKALNVVVKIHHVSEFFPQESQRSENSTQFWSATFSYSAQIKNLQHQEPSSGTT